MEDLVLDTLWWLEVGHAKTVPALLLRFDTIVIWAVAQFGSVLAMCIELVDSLCVTYETVVHCDWARLGAETRIRAIWFLAYQSVHRVTLTDGCAPAVLASTCAEGSVGEGEQAYN